MPEVINIPFAGARGYLDMPGQIQLARETTMTLNNDGNPVFGKEWAVYPVTIAQARYRGSYEGAAWLCFPVGPAELQSPFWSGWNDGDVPCMQWWETARKQKYPIGYGADPSAAYADLIQRLLGMVNGTVGGNDDEG